MYLKEKTTYRVDNVYIESMLIEVMKSILKKCTALPLTTLKNSRGKHLKTRRKTWICEIGKP